MIRRKKIMYKIKKDFGGAIFTIKYCISKEERRCANLISGPSGDCV